LSRVDQTLAQAIQYECTQTCEQTAGWCVSELMKEAHDHSFTSVYKMGLSRGTQHEIQHSINYVKGSYVRIRQIVSQVEHTSGILGATLVRTTWQASLCRLSRVQGIQLKALLIQAPIGTPTQDVPFQYFG
jgi:hypothetical protein